MPHSLEAEECLLSCCLLDGADVVARCIEAQLGPRSFYDSKHGVIFSCLLDLYHRRRPTDIAIVAEELKAGGQLDEIGSYSFLEQVSHLIPTTAQASYFIAKVRELDRLRAAIRTGAAFVESAYGFSGGSVSEHLAHAFEELRNSLEDQPTSGAVMPWNSLMNFDPKQDPDSLMGRRFLCRTGGAVLVAPSGVGKSVLSVQWSSCAALGRPFFGLHVRAPLRVLYVQAEDDIGDVAEAVQGVVREYDITGADLALLRENMRIVRWNDAAGDKFLARLRAEYRVFRYDLVVANPLFSFCGCDVSKQAEMSRFLRNGLNPILNETGAACVIVHHTNKPKDDEKPGKGDEELRYVMSGSGEITNWARAIVALQQVKAAGSGTYKMAFVKRGLRAGLVDAEGRPTTSVLIQHSARGLCWIPSSYSPRKDRGQFEAKIDIQRARAVFVRGLPWPRNKAAIAEDQGLSERAVHDYRDDIESELEAVA